jgi:hypothetical protein
MAKVELKTQLTDASVKAFVDKIADEQQRIDTTRLLEIFGEVTGEEPKMWGPAIIGFGVRHLKYDSGREMDWMIIGFSPRKGNLTLYVGLGTDNRYDDLLSRLGKHKTGKGCLYIKKLSDVDESALIELIAASFKTNKG